MAENIELENTDLSSGSEGADAGIKGGAEAGADEGADLVLRLLYENYNLYFSPNLVFYHPNKESKQLK